MMASIVQLIVFMLPAYIANMAPVFARKLPFLAVPLDGGRTIRGKRIFGPHKTVRGIVLGVCAGVLTAWIESILVPFFGYAAIGPYQQWLVLGLLLSLGALAGDALKSFFKRQFGIESGKPWVPFDQIDYALGALALTSIIYFPGWINALYIVLISMALHFVVNLIGYFLKIRKQMW